MSFFNKVLYSAAGAEAGGGFYLPSSPADPGQVVTVYSSDSPALEVPQVDPLIAQSNPNPNALVAPAAAPGEPAGSQAADPYPVLTPDGKMVNVYVPDDYGGQRLFTQIPNNPQAIASYASNNLARLRELQLARNQPAVQQQAPVIPQEPPPSLRERYQAMAEKHARQTFGDETEVGPLAATLAAMLADLKSEEIAESQEYSRRAQIGQEYTQVKQIDPTFDIQNPLVVELRQNFPNDTPLQIHQRMVYLDFMSKNQAGAQTQAPASAQALRIQSPPQAFVTPQGTTQVGSADPLDNHPEVVEALSKHAQFMRDAGRQATPESTVRARESAKMSIRNRNTFIPQGPNRPLGV